MRITSVIAVVLMIASVTVTGCSNFFDVVPVSAPTTIVVTQESDTSNYISWTAVAGATGYKVYRSTSVSSNYEVCTTITGGSVL
jgi:fibronectin type 3 domain-containing protein